MLTSIFHALYEHLTRLGLPVYLADCVPETAAFPYITVKIAAPLAPHASGSVTVTLWSLDEQANSHRLSQADQLLNTLPARGLLLETDMGALVLRQTGGALCVRESAALGMRTVYKLHCFPKQ